MIFGIRGGLPVAAALAAAVGFGAWAGSASAADVNTRTLATGAADRAAEVQLAQDAAAGLRAFIRCRACHTIGEGEAHRVGPNLFGVVGRAAGTAEGYEKYSDAMKDSGIVWDDETLAGYLAAPAAYVEGNLMKFPGAPPADIPNLIAYLTAAGQPGGGI